MPCHDTKYPFLRALREVAPEMELFLENHAWAIYTFLDKIILHTKLYILPFYKKKCILKNMSE